MVVVISPAKRIDDKKQAREIPFTVPENLDISENIMKNLRKLSKNNIMELMKVNAKIAELNFERFHTWEPTRFDKQHAKQTLLSFKGDVFLGIDPETFTSDDFEFAQQSLRILSGLHGMLRPLDLILPYRLEMGTKMKIGRNKNLYEVWTDIITRRIKQELSKEKQPVLINLASQEYFKSIDLPQINCRMITPDFREFKNGEYKFVHVLGKKARGLMTRYIIRNKITDAEQMKLFDYEGYFYNDNLSSEDQWVFTR